MKNSKTFKLVFAIILLLGLINIIYWSTQKEGYFVDELYTYGLANSYMTPFLQTEDNYVNAYHKGTEFFEWLTVSEEDAFRFDSVWYNQSQDVHPPFYYVMIHLISSIWKETMTPWIGIAVNYLFGVALLPIFYKIAEKICKNRWNALAVTVMYVLSAGTINCILMIRMYMMLTFWILLYVWIMMQFFEYQCKGKQEILQYITVCIIIICGFLTHYHFVIPATVISGIYVVYCIVHKNIKRIFFYILSCISAMVATQYIFEYSFNHIFIGYRGVEAIRNAKSADLFERMEIMWQYANEQIFGGCFLLVVIVFVFGLILSFIKKKKHTDKEKTKKERLNTLVWMQLTIICTAVLYFAVVSKTITFLVSRYVYPIYPFIILTVFVTADGITECFRSKYRQIWVWGITVVCLVLSYIVPGEPESLYRLNAVVPNIVKEHYDGTDAIYVTDCSYRYVSDSYVLSMHNDIYVADFNVIEDLPLFGEGKEVILYINHWAYEPEVGEATHEIDYYLELAEPSGYSSYEYIGDTEHSKVYVLNKAE